MRFLVATKRPFRERARSNEVVGAIVDAHDFFRGDLEDQAVDVNAAIGERDADPRVGQFTGKATTVASVEAAIAVLQRATFFAWCAA